eukprot:4539343-Pleurochrysis_carterae.AAC.10
MIPVCGLPAAAPLIIGRTCPAVFARTRPPAGALTAVVGRRRRAGAAWPSTRLQKQHPASIHFGDFSFVRAAGFHSTIMRSIYDGEANLGTKRGELSPAQQANDEQTFAITMKYISLALVCCTYRNCRRGCPDE